MWSYEVWQLYILIIGTVWIGCRMTLFSMTLHQHSFNLFISVAFQDKLLCSQELQLPPFRSWGAETQRPGKSLDQSTSSSASPTAPFCPPELRPNLPVLLAPNLCLHKLSTHWVWQICSTRGEGLLLQVPHLGKGGSENGWVPLCTLAATSRQLGWPNGKVGLNNRTERIQCASNITVTAVGFPWWSCKLGIFLTAITLNEKKMKFCSTMGVMKDGESSCLSAHLLFYFPQLWIRIPLRPGESRVTPHPLGAVNPCYSTEVGGAGAIPFQLNPTAKPPHTALRLPSAAQILPS